MQKLAPGFSERSFFSERPHKRETSILAVLRFEKPFERDVFRFNPFSTFRETTFVRVYWNAILVSRHGMAPHVNESSKEDQRNKKTHFRGRVKVAGNSFQYFSRLRV